jgi:hypothetical protein
MSNPILGPTPELRIIVVLLLAILVVGILIWRTLGTIDRHIPYPPEPCGRPDNPCSVVIQGR